MKDPDLQKRFREQLALCDAAHLEYEEEHGDAGNAYTHCVIEDKGYAVKRLKEYVTENMPEVTPDELKEIMSRLDGWSFDMEPGHRFTTVSVQKGVVLNGFPIEEVENQYEVKVLAEQLGCEVEEVRELVLAENDFCIGTLYRENFDTFETYQITDCCWFAVLPKCWIEDTLNEIREEAAEAAAEASEVE